MPQNISYWIYRDKNDKHLDWRMGEKNWIEGYWKSIKHPHRQVVLQVLRELLPWRSLIEVGCNCGPNLYLIQKEFPGAKLAGVDVNIPALEFAIKKLKKVKFYINKADNLLLPDDSFDILLTDAVLIYVEPEKIRKTILEFRRITKKAMVLVEWYDKDVWGKVRYRHWARNYPKLLRRFGIKKVDSIKITKDIWPSENWANLGYIFIARLQ